MRILVRSTDAELAMAATTVVKGVLSHGSITILVE
jgi:hypothetical protein